MSAIEKINAQQKGKENTAVWMVGEQLKDILHREPAHEELIDRDLDIAEMSLEKAEDKIHQWANKQKRTKNCVCVPPNVAEDIIREFYGIPKANERAVPETVKPQSSIIDLADFI